jgi:hypothetical protein
MARKAKMRTVDGMTDRDIFSLRDEGKIFISIIIYQHHRHFYWQRNKNVT